MVRIINTIVTDWPSQVVANKTYQTMVRVFDQESMERVSAAFIQLNSDPMESISFAPAIGYTSSVGELTFELIPKFTGKLFALIKAVKVGYECHHRDCTMRVGLVSSEGPSEASSIFGTVHSSLELGKMVADAAVSLDGFVTTTDANGEFKVENVPAKVYTLKVAHNKYWTFTGELDASKPGEYHPTVSLNPKVLSLVPQLAVPFGVGVSGLVLSQVMKSPKAKAK